MSVDVNPKWMIKSGIISTALIYLGRRLIETVLDESAFMAHSFPNDSDPPSSMLLMGSFRTLIFWPRMMVSPY
jgi:hypothetical protein